VLSIKRAYAAPEASDGFRVLVDRLWPRGVSKERAALDLWLKDVAPSTSLRSWFDHRADRFDEFARRYAAELEGNPAVERLREIIQEHSHVTLVYGAKDPQVNQAAVLVRYLTN
jgi:uncharacterized protein YeaO (DUF488 family)